MSIETNPTVPRHPRFFLLVVGRPLPPPGAVKPALKEFYQGEFLVWGEGITPAVLEEWGLSGSTPVGPGRGLRETWRCLRSLRRTRLEEALFVGRREDLIGQSVVALSGARRRLFREERLISPRRGKVRAWLLLPRLAARLILFFFSLVCLVFLRCALSPLRKKIAASDSFSPASQDLHPPVSIIIPNYNGRALLAQCLPSIEAACSRYRGSSEIIVVDDASRDGSAAWTRRTFPAVKVIALEENLGFGRASNLGVEAAAHRLVILLNSDIKVEEDFLLPLLKHLALPAVFAVQPRMEEWDGSGLNLGINMGRMEDGYIRIWNEREAAEAASVRSCMPSLYAVGGAMAFDREKWRVLGGFDDIFRPFCWEDIDISYRAWKRGWKVLYEPASRVRHLHHGTISRFFTPDFKQTVERKNELLFTWKNIHSPVLWKAHWRRLPRLLLISFLGGDPSFRRGFRKAGLSWRRARRQRAKEASRSVLRDETVFRKSLLPHLNLAHGAAAAGFGERKPRLLMLNTVVPYPPEDGGKMRIYQMLRNLAAACDIHFICFYRTEDELKNLEGIKGFCRQAEAVRLVPAGMGPLAKALIPRFCQAWICPEMTERIAQILATEAIDIVQMDFTLTAFYRLAVKDHPVIFVEHDAGILIPGRSYNPSLRGWRKILEFYEWLRTVNYELKLVPSFDRVVTLNREDEKLLKSFLPGLDVRTVTQGVDLDRFTPASPSLAGNRKMVFLGSLVHYPNIDAIDWLVEEILPRLRLRVPDAELRLVGSGDPARLGDLKSRPGVEFVGRVDDVRPSLSECAVFAAPLRLGSGMKGKVLEAMALGMAVVATGVGASGIPARPGEEIILADSAEEFAAAVAELLEDSSRRERIGRAARVLVEKHFHWKTKAEEMLDVYRALMRETYE